MSNGIKDIVTESLMARVKGILLKPVEEWKAVEAEATDSRTIYLKYVAVLGIIGPVAMFIGQSLIGYSVPLFGTFRVSIVSGIVTAAVMYALTFVGVFLVALIVDAMAPTFGGQKDSLRALKVTAYSYTAAWLAAVFQIIPSLAWIGIIAGLYGIYLLYLGLPVLMRAPKEKAVGYTATVCVVAIVIYLILGAIGGAVSASAGFGTSHVFGSNERGTEVASSWLSTLFGGKTDEDRQRVADSIKSLAKMGENAKSDEGSSSGDNGKPTDLGQALNDIGRIATGGSNIKPVDFHALKDLLPDTAAGLDRESISGESNQALGIRASKATAEYSEGDKHITIEITDMGSLSGLAGLAAKFNPDLDKETDSGYERTRNVDGQLMHEQYDNDNNSGEVEFIAGNRFAISVHGSNVGMDELTAVLKKIDYDKLGTLAQAE